MKSQLTTTIKLTHEEIQEAVAQFVSKNLVQGRNSATANDVRLNHKDCNILGSGMDVEAVITINHN